MFTSFHWLSLMFIFACDFHQIIDVANTRGRSFCLCGHPGIILSRLRQAWQKFLGGDIILVSSCPSSGLTPSSWHHPGSLSSKTMKFSIVTFCIPGNLIIPPDQMIMLILRQRPAYRRPPCFISIYLVT